jgi:signal transduction histidine kinase
MEIARSIHSSLNLDEVVDRVLDGAVRFSGAERGFLFLREGDDLVPRVGGHRGGPSVDVSRSVAEEVARTGRPFHRDDLSSPSAGSLTDSIVRLRLQAILCLPLAVAQDVIGVIYLDSRRPLPRQDQDPELIEALAGLAAVAIQNSRLVEKRVREERTLAIGQMARAVVHDLRSPLTSIRALAELLHGRCPESDPARRHLATIVAEADRLAELTGDLLRFSRESPPPARLEASLADLVRQTIEPLRPLLERARIAADLDLDDEAKAFVDAPGMARALHNLVSNALEAMPAGGTLRLRCGVKEGRAVIRVEDTGCGMSEEVRRRIFDPFFTHGKPRGTGLGLAIVRAIVEEHGGVVRVDSAPGRGSAFEVDLPAAHPTRRTH